MQHTYERALDLKRVKPNDAGQYQLDTTTARIIASHDLTYQGVAKCFSSAPRHIARIAHLHLQWGYGSPSVQSNVTLGLSQTDIGITPAEFLTMDMASRFPAVEWVTVQNGVDAKRFSASTDDERSEFRRLYQIPEHATLCAFVGRLEEAKGLQVLHALGGMLRSADLHLLVQFPAHLSSEHQMRSAAAAEALRSTDPRHIHLYPDTDPYIGQRPVRFCDALIHPSLSEVAPLTAIEAWMSGVPVIATRSTPFYEETGLSSALRLIDLPEGVDWTQVAQSDLHLRGNTAQHVARALLRAARESVPPSDVRRRTTANEAMARGFASTVMIERLRALYDRFEFRS